MLPALFLHYEVHGSFGIAAFSALVYATGWRCRLFTTEISSNCSPPPVLEAGASTMMAIKPPSHQRAAKYTHTGSRLPLPLTRDPLLLIPHVSQHPCVAFGPE
ncbi:unnamed protein product, partial [Ectocarpus sp. 8 AP-2014]